MADYAEMYKVLFRAVTKAIEGLQEAQIATEELYISADDPVITIVQPDNKTEDGDHD